MGKKKIRIKLFESKAAMEGSLPLKRARTLRIRNKDICLVHSPEGFFAVQDKCPHNGFSLGRGWCSDRMSIVCPLHRYDFDLKTGRGLSGIADTLITYPIIITEKGVFLEMEEGWSLW